MVCFTKLEGTDESLEIDQAPKKETLVLGDPDLFFAVNCPRCDFMEFAPVTF